MLLDWLSSETGIKKERLLVYAATASKRYFVYPIDKKDGGKRWIAHPAKPIKAIQRWLNSRVIKSWDVHDAAVAYQRGSSIRTNAMRHVSTNFTVRIDFKEFFPSFKREKIIRFIQEKTIGGFPLGEVDINFIADIVTRNGEVTIGAPSSPILTNAMMYEFDKNVSSYCEVRNLIYTRYADDIFISSFDPNGLHDSYNFVRELSQNYQYANLIINKNKTFFLSRKYKRSITGLVITSDRRISIGRSRKKEIKSLIFDFENGNLSEEKIDYLRGILAFSYDSDREFFESLKRKYGDRIVGKLIG